MAIVSFFQCARYPAFYFLTIPERIWEFCASSESFRSQTYTPLAWWICCSNSSPPYEVSSWHKLYRFLGCSIQGGTLIRQFLFNYISLGWALLPFFSLFPSITKGAQTLGIAKGSWGESHHNSLTVPHLSLSAPFYNGSGLNVKDLLYVIHKYINTLCPRAIMSRKLYPSPKCT